MIDTVHAQDEGQAKISPGALRNAIKKELSTKENRFRCVAVYIGRQADQVIVRARNEVELRRIKEAASKIALSGTTVLRDQLYPLKVDSVSRLAVPNGDSFLQTDIAEGLGEENNTNIAKVVWLSNKENNKAYGSMAVYFIKSGEETVIYKTHSSMLVGNRDPPLHLNAEKVKGSVINAKSMAIERFNVKGNRSAPNVQVQATTTVYAE